MVEEQFVDIVELVESRIQHKIATYSDIMVGLLEMAVVGEDVYLCHREDCHEQSPSTHHYYIDLTRLQFLAMGGKELECMKTVDERVMELLSKP